MSRVSKELEALKRVVSEISHYKLHGIGDENWLGIQDVLKDVVILEKALTPPTAEEVCEALREHYKHYVCYSEVSNEFKFEDSEDITRHGIYGYQVVDYMPPHLITLIGRFYDGLEKEEKE